MAEKIHFYHSEDTETYYIEETSSAFLHLTNSHGTSLGCSLPSLDHFTEIKKEISLRFSASDIVTAKVVGPHLLNRQLQQKLVGQDILIEKAIYTESYKLFYNASQSSIKLSKEDYKKVRVLIVDDSKVIRDIIKKCLTEHKDIEVVGEAENGQGLIEKIKVLKPHVITLDMQMPVVNGVMALKQYYSMLPVPTVVVSAVSLEEGSLAMEAMESGATDYLQKPLFDDLSAFKEQLYEKIIAAFSTKYFFAVKPKSGINIQIKTDGNLVDTDRLIAIGSSTGGTEALRDILTRLPKNIPPILIVQHIPAVFSKSFAERMNSLCPFEVKEAESGDVVAPSKVFIAPGGKQMKLEKRGSDYVIQITDDAPVNRHKPSVDYLFFNLVEVCKKKIVGVILTGMGSDGAKGLKALKDNGAKTIGQNETSCVVYGMPQAAHKLGAVEHVLHLHDIPVKILDLVSTGQKKAS